MTTCRVQLQAPKTQPRCPRFCAGVSRRRRISWALDELIADLHPERRRPVPEPATHGERRMTGARKCGAVRKGKPPCTQPRGWGTDHPGYGSCKRRLAYDRAGKHLITRARTLAEIVEDYPLRVTIDQTGFAVENGPPISLPAWWRP